MTEEVPRSGGVVLRFNDQKGFGFIKPDDGGDDLFVHHTDIKYDGYRTLYPGQLVEFYVLLDENKTKAVEVTGPNGSPLEPRAGGGRFGGGGGYGGARGGGGGGYGGARGGGECYTCGRAGHMARDCDRGVRGGGGGGRGGGGYGAVRGGGGAGNGVCFNCGGIGHMARDCTSARNAVAGGGGGGLLGGGCYTCGERGHLARECPIGTGGGGAGAGRGYDRFGGSGGGGRGYDRFVGGSAGGGGGRGGGSCYNCGEPGHYAKECRNNVRE